MARQTFLTGPTRVVIPPPPPSGGGGIQHGEDVTADNVGLHVATTNTHASGFLYDSDAAFSGHAISGDGSQGDPYIIEKRRYVQDVRVRDTPGIYVVFRHCKFEGNPGNPTPSGSAFVWVEGSGAFVTIEDSTLTTVGGPSTSSTAGGCGFGFLSYVPFTLRRCDISMAVGVVYFEIERGEAASLIEECYMHHCWSSAGDHTDMVNGNFRASHITVRRSKIYGMRTGNAYCTNGFGIYDTPEDQPSGIIEDWTIEDCYVDHNATHMLSTNSSSRFLDPFVVTGNIFTDDYSVQLYSTRTPSSQSNNRDQDGNPITF